MNNMVKITTAMNVTAKHTRTTNLTIPGGLYGTTWTILPAGKNMTNLKSWRVAL